MPIAELLLVLAAAQAAPPEIAPSEAVQTEAAPAPDASAATYAPPPMGEVRAAVTAYLDRRTALRGEPLPNREELLSAWDDLSDAAPPAERLDLLADTLRAADPAIEDLLATLDPLGPPPEERPDVDFAIDSSDPFARDHLRLLVGRTLARLGMYDDALAELEGLDPAQLVDPATALYYRAVSEHQLLMREEALSTLSSLLERTARVPEPMTALAGLMRGELEETEPESLREVAGMMRDVERRLDLGDSGPKVRKREDEIIARLDAIIEKLQAQAGGGGGGGGGGGEGGGDAPSPSNQSSNPGSDSVLKGSQAAGDADMKPADGPGGWGDLPEKEQARARSLLDRDYPGHYRRVVEEYFRKSAEEN
ncbi:hypothetical protein [Alienimonas californiensis]|uniref:Tetratricopeptide repeat protein n=1 Tax=Alienimonas californiensis TaxID=2527989 RepID=A0A517PDA6_9PLAN|nr:hypothetical protein [Alienimonas californiensis]QDT17311.1 hypothetical protein CA12_34310 [Alienimonas californiensis]